MAASGWFRDPSGRHELRFFDDGWTEHVRDGEHPGNDPVRPQAWPPPHQPHGQSAADVLAEAQRQRSEAGLPPAGSDEKKSGCLPALVALVVFAALIGGCVALLGSDDDASADDLEYGAFDVCKQVVREQLKAPSTAKFRNFFEDDGEVVVTGVGDGPYTVMSTVDAENSFGASLRLGFTCEVRHVPDSDRWQLVALDLDE